MNKVPSQRRSFSALVEIVTALRGPNGCPWDKEQTHRTLTRFAIEEAHELGEAIDSGDIPHIVEELGDLLLQVVLHSEIGRQEQSFTLEDVIEGICDKMIRRHPHVFGEQKLSTSSEVLAQWSVIKAQEKSTEKKSGFGLPKDLPALIASQKIGEKTTRAKFDFEDLKQAFGKVKEEVAEFEAAMTAGDEGEMASELGDILFAAAQAARFCNSDAEQALRESNRRFEKRFFTMIGMSDNFESLSSEEKEKLWQTAKKKTDPRKTQ